MIKFSDPAKKLILEIFVILFVCAFLASSEAYFAVHSSSNESAKYMSDLNSGTFVSRMTVQFPKINPVSLTNSSNVRDNYVRCNFTIYSVDEDGNVSVIYGLTGKLNKNIKIEGTPALMAFSPSYEYGYVDNVQRNGKNITVINTKTNSVIGNITGLLSPTDIAVSSNGSMLYVSSCLSDNLSIVSLPSGKIIKQIDVGAPQGGIALSPNGSFLYVTEELGSVVKVYNAYNFSPVVSIGGFNKPAFVAFSPNGSCAYITNFGSGNVSVINTSTYKLVMNYSEVYLTDEITISPNGEYAYVAVNSNTNGVPSKLSVIDLSTHQIIKNISLGGFLGSIAISPDCSYIYVANDGTGNITVLSTLNYGIVENLTGYSDPFGVYVVPTYAYYVVTLSESGLPSGTTWYVNLSNGMDSGPITGSSYSFSLINGTYSYTIATSDKTYEPSPSSGSLTVDGNSVSKSVTFSEVKYTVTFAESGLPSGTTWYVNLSNGMDSGPITGSSYSFSLINGTYSFTVGNVTGYSVSPSSGTITVTGSSISKTISYTAISVPPAKTPSSGITSIEIYGIIGAVVAVAAIGSVIALLRKKR